MINLIILYLGHDVFLKVHIIRESHPAGVDTKDSSLGFFIGKRELNLPVNSARSDEGGVEGLNPVGRHDHLHISAGIEAIQLIEQLQHGSLDLPLTSAVAVVSLGSHSVNLINEDNAGTVLLGHAEQFPH